jgi:hypothetical protein
MKSFFIFLFTIILSNFLFSFCPVCTVAVGAGAGILRAYGIDDTITGAWYGALVFSTFFYIIEWLNKKHIKFLFRKPLIFILSYLIFVAPLYLIEGINLSKEKIFGIEKFLFGVIVGSIVFVFAIYSDSYIRKHNNNKAKFPFQKVLIPVFYLSILSIIIYILLS